ncbi:MAG: hypothetical protein QQN41_11015 [Nitrosopumilus sp.]
MADYTIEVNFPRIRNDYVITSPIDPSYNCIAFAADDTTKRWWPSASLFWPAGIKREETLDAFIDCYALLGYRACGKNQKLDMKR